MRHANLWSIMLVGLVASNVTVGSSPAQSTQALPLSPARRAQMQHHFAEASRILEAVIRGDLVAVAEPAMDLAALPAPSGMPSSAGPFIEFVRLEGRRAMSATSIPRAAEAASSILTLCGDCHRTVGVAVAPIETARPDVGGVVGHMLEHQRAVDAMVEGLIAPSVSRWQAGAARLQGAPLQPDQLPSDSRLRSELRQAEARVHAIGGQALAAETPTERTAVFTSLIATCSDCHSVHPRIWGPDSAGRGPGR